MSRFVNDPYFKYLKQACEKYNFQPTDIGLIGNQDVKSIKSCHMISEN